MGKRWFQKALPPVELIHVAGPAELVQHYVLPTLSGNQPSHFLFSVSFSLPLCFLFSSSLFSILDPEIHDAKRGGAKLRKRSRAVEPAGSEEALISHGEQGRAARQLELPRRAGAHGLTRSRSLAMESGTTRRNGRSSFKKYLYLSLSKNNI